MTRRNLPTTLAALVLVALLGLGLNACCGTCGEDFDPNDLKIDEPKVSDKDDDDEEEPDLDLGKVEEKDKDDDLDIPPPKKEKEDKGDKGGSAKLDPITVKEMKPAELERRIKALGWNVLGEPTESKQRGMRGVVYPVTKGATGGAVSMYEYKQKNIAKTFESSMKKQKAATVRDKGKVIVVHFPNKPDVANEVMDQIMGR